MDTRYRTRLRLPSRTLAGGGRGVTLHRGSCHCGAVRFEVDGELGGLEVCNCSLCVRNGYIHWYVPPERFRLLTSWEGIETYTFGTRTARHHFCRRCGLSAFRRARSNPKDIDVNVRCLEGVDLDALEVTSFDGQNWEAQMETRGR
jgi:hypothetical protein